MKVTEEKGIREFSTNDQDSELYFAWSSVRSEWIEMCGGSEGFIPLPYRFTVYPRKVLVYRSLFRHQPPSGAIKDMTKLPESPPQLRAQSKAVKGEVDLIASR